MNLFLKKITLLLVLALLILATLNTFLPSYWGNEVISKKFKQIEELNQDVNTIFIGTSRIHSHINPFHFEKKTNSEVNAYNIGSPGAAGLETRSIVTDLINNSDNHSISTIFLEMPSYFTTTKTNEHNVRATYFFTLNNWAKSILFTLSSHKSSLNKGKDILQCTKLLLSNMLSINNFSFKIKVLFEKLVKKKYTIHSKKGFYGIKHTIKNYKTIQGRHEQAKRFYANGINNTQLENAFLTQDILALVSQATAKDINLVYVLMPKIPYSKFNESYHSFKKLPVQNRLNLSNPSTHQKFYQPKYSSDKAHLNTKGAKLLTNAFARHYNKYSSTKIR